MQIFDLFEFNTKIELMDIGAAAIAEVPIYKTLLEKDLAHLTAFDGDERQIGKIKDLYGPQNVSIHNKFVFDGKKHKLHVCDPASGMTSLFKPKEKALLFFNGFQRFGAVEKVEDIPTTRLDDIENLNLPHFLKMDVQGAELGILENGKIALGQCLAMQLEVSYIALYEGQPSFGDIDVHMRSNGFVPHCFLDLKRWSIAPTIFDNNFRIPGNQLLESDIVYIKDPLELACLDEAQIQTLVILSHYCFRSVDLCIWLLLELERRNLIKSEGHKHYLEHVNSFS